MLNDIAGKHNTSKVSKSATNYIMTQGGKLIGHWSEDGATVYELDAYGGILGTHTLGVNCVRVVRNRVTTVTETFTVEA